MIDLSFLTEEEQEAIMKVLQRDAALKRAEEERVRHLPEKIKDDQQLKNMSGQWFYEAKAKRHRDKIHGADIIRASMRKKRLQVAAEQSKDRAMRAKESWVNNVDRDAFLPPELAGVVEEPEEDAAPASPRSDVVNPASTVTDTSQENARKSALSPSKQRKNPFNSSKLPEDHLLQQTKNEQSKDGRAGLFQISKQGELPGSEAKASNPDSLSPKLENFTKLGPTKPADGTQIKAPIPKARKLIYKSNGGKQDDSQSFPRQRTDSLSARGPPRGILKRNSSSSSTDSETLRLNYSFEPKSKSVPPGLTIPERISEKEHSFKDDSSLNSLEPLKHVRFSAMKDELPPSPGLSHGREVGEFQVLESDKLKNRTEDLGGIDECGDDPKPSHRKPSSFHPPASSPSISENKTHQPGTSGFVHSTGLHSPTEVLTAHHQLVENLSTIDEHQDKPSELTRPESELSKISADELSYCVEPEPSQIPDHNVRHHQQGKPLLTALNAEISSCSGPCSTEIRKTTDDSISKVLDWFNRSSHSEDSNPSLQPLQETDLRPKSNSASQATIAIVTDHTCLKEDGSKAVPSTKVNLKPVRYDSTFQAQREMLTSETCQDNDVNIKSNSMNWSQQGIPKEGPDILQPCRSHRTQSQGSKNMDYSQTSKCKGVGSGSPSPNDDNTFSVDAKNHVPCNTKPTGSLNKEPKLPESEKNEGNSQAKFDSSTIVQEPNLINQVKTERKSKKENTSGLRASVETENNDMPLKVANSGSPRKKPKVQLQQEVGEIPKTQVRRERYKRVSERISFWEGEKAGAKLTEKAHTSLRSQEQFPTNIHQPVKSQVMSMDNLSSGQNECSQVIAKRVILDEDDQAPHPSSFYSSNKPEKVMTPLSGPSKNYPSADQSDEPSLFQNTMNEHRKRLPMEGSLHSRRDSSLPVLKCPSNNGNEMHPSLEKDRFVIDESNANFKILSLKEGIDEPNVEQAYNHSHFENLRKFWNLGANPNNKDNYENTRVNQEKSVPFSSQKSKEFNDLKVSGKNPPERKTHLSQENIMVKEEKERLNPKYTSQVLPDETTSPQKPPRTFTYQLVGKNPSIESMEKTMEWFVAPVIKKKDYLAQEIQESIVQTNALFKDHKDALNDRLQKLLSEASTAAIHPSHGGQIIQIDGSENKAWSPKDFADSEEGAVTPKQSSDECVDDMVLPEVEQNTLVASLDNLVKEKTRTSPSPLQTTLEPVTRTISQSEDVGIFERRIKKHHSSSADQRELIAPFPEGREALGSSAVSQKAEGSECQLNTENMLQLAQEGPKTVHFHREGSLGEVANYPSHTSFGWDVHLGPQDRALTSHREISETIEKVVLPTKPALNDITAALQGLLREACSRECMPGEGKAEFPEGGQVGGSPPNPLDIMMQRTTMNTVPDRKDFDPVHGVPDKAREVGPNLSSLVSLSEQLISSSVPTVAQNSKDLPQEVTEIVREKIIQPKSECLEFRAGLENLLKETLETSLRIYEKDKGALYLSEVVGSCDMPKQAASDFHPKEIRETVEKTEAPSVTENALDSGLEKLLKEISEAPLQLQLLMVGETPEKEPSQEAGIKPNSYEEAPGTSKMKVKSKGLQSQINPRHKLLEGDEALTEPSVDVQSYTSGVEVPETSLTMTLSAIRPLEDKNWGSNDAEGPGAFQELSFEEVPKRMSMSRNQQPSPLLANRESPTKISKVELMLATLYKRQDNGQGIDIPSESDFLDGNAASNADSWRNTSSSEGEPSPVLKTLERSAARKMPSKSLEDISSDSSNQAKVDNLPEELVRSAEDVSTVPSLPDNKFSHSDKLKRMSKSVPVFLQDESDDRETDTASESSYQLRRHKKSPSSLTNLSSSSGMTSLSSVSGSVMSVYSGDFGNLEVKGNIQFAVDYVESLKELHVFVAQCKDLAAADVKKQRSDPYVKAYLLPDKGKMGKKKTLVMKKTLNPVYNEILRYKIEKQYLKTQKLNLSVWHRDTFKRNSFLGEVELDLDTWDWDNKQNKQLKWYPLKRKTAPVALEAESRGEMKLALQYVPEPVLGKKLSTTGEVHIWVKECFDLPLLRGNHLNSFVKCTILPDTSRKSRQKTRAVGKTTHPIFNHTMVYDGFRPEDLTEACVELTVWDHYKLTNQFLGGLRIGFGTGKSYGTEVDWMDSTSEEVALWEKMVNSPNTWIEATLPLRMLLIAKISK
uniref:synaptotagmin-like protein 2 isoform X2 n=1 Tax=Jaculus jaculus TaxID=51337 RepID=UPI001E1B454F|nr:synaptotagmin-like protein 2 isoform X2 [Jaculus jaculus]